MTDNENKESSESENSTSPFYTPNEIYTLKNYRIKNYQYMILYPTLNVDILLKHFTLS